MLQDSPTNWDLRVDYRVPLDEQLFVLFTFAEAIFVFVKLLRISREAPSFRRSLPIDLPAHALKPRLHAVSLKRWILFPLFALLVALFVVFTQWHRRLPRHQSLFVPPFPSPPHHLHFAFH